MLDGGEDPITVELQRSSDPIDRSAVLPLVVGELRIDHPQDENEETDHFPLSLNNTPCNDLDRILYKYLQSSRSSVYYWASLPFKAMKRLHARGAAIPARDVSSNSSNLAVCLRSIDAPEHRVVVSKGV